MATLTDLTVHGVTFDDHLDMTADIPVLAALQAQGDVICIPLDLHPLATTRPEAVWSECRSVPVVRGENGGNTHLLVADAGVARWTTDLREQASGLNLGIVECTTPVWLLHPQHGGMGLAAGRWLLRRQREQMAELRQVAD